MARRGQEDFNYHRAKQEGYAARSVYKLQDLDKRYHLLKPAMKVLDLGCHPGSWLQYIADKIGKTGKAVGVDLQPVTIALPEQACFIQADLLEISAQELRVVCAQFDAVLSDVAPRTSGVAHRDAARSAQLVERGLELAQGLLKPGGNFVAKIFWSQDAAQVLGRMKTMFRTAKAHKPGASQVASREIYLLGLEKLI